ncbi:MAG: hypothetical protein ACREFT_11940, partial [Acetobacteraceae bacterium]
MSGGVVSVRLGDALGRLAQGVEGALAGLGRMIAIDTSFPPATGYAEFAGLMQELLAPLGFAFRRVTVPPALCGGAVGERINLIAKCRASGRPTCSLYFHVDTVPPGDGWSFPPFVATRMGNRLYGR